MHHQNLVSDDGLERSSVVANCNMNRERELHGSNGYEHELGFDPVEWLNQRLLHRPTARWLDLCCGTGRALAIAADIFTAEEKPIEIVGVDLVNMFLQHDFDCLRFHDASLSTWSPSSLTDAGYDLITCIHGLHYVGDKLGLISRAVGWLEQDGLFVANLDLKNIVLDGKTSTRFLARELRNFGFEYSFAKHLLSWRGQAIWPSPFQYSGADDRAGPNYTNQPAVNSHYATKN